jgi:hypothetical protein
MLWTVRCRVVSQHTRHYEYALVAVQRAADTRKLLYTGANFREPSLKSWCDRSLGVIACPRNPGHPSCRYRLSALAPSPRKATQLQAKDWIQDAADYHHG